MDLDDMHRLRLIAPELHKAVLEAESDLMAVKRAAIEYNNPKEGRRIFNNMFPERKVEEKAPESDWLGDSRIEGYSNTTPI